MKKLPHNWQELKSLLRLGVVGCSNTLVDFVVFTILRAAFDINYLLCQVVGYSAGVLNSFIFNKMWTFESRTSHFRTSLQFARFLVINLLSLSVSLLGLKIMSDYWNLNVYVAKVAMTAVAQVINYSGYRFWVFGKKSNSAALAAADISD